MQLYLFNIAPLCEKAAQSFYLPYLSPARQARAMQAKVPLEKARRLAAGLLLTRLLPSDSEKRLCHNPAGKPYLRGGPFFNLSHSGHFIFLAIGQTEMGVDIQQHEPYHAALVRRFFHPSEAIYLERLPAAGRAKAFCRLWSLKEAHCKASGTGIAHNFRQYRIELANGTAQIWSDTQQLPFAFHEYGLAGYQLVLCTRQPLERPQLRQLTLNGIKKLPK